MSSPGKSPSKCNVCGKEYKLASILKRHFNSAHAGKKIYSCGICGRGFGRKDVLKDHQLIVHTTKRTHWGNEVEGGVQKQTFTEFHNIEWSHNKTSSVEIPPMEITPVDNYNTNIPYGSTPFEDTTQVQMVSISTSQDLEAEKNCVHMCVECRKTFSTTNALDEHMKLHPDEDSHVCPSCNQGFPGHSELLQHMVCHFDEYESTGTSDISRSTQPTPTSPNPASQGQMVSGQTPHHINIESAIQIEPQQPVYNLNILQDDGMNSAQTVSLNVSKKGAAAQQIPFPVTTSANQVADFIQTNHHAEPSVQHTFSYRDNPPSNYVDHTMDDYVCPYCQVGFILAADLRTHISNQHEKDQYFCTDCKKEFSDPTALKQHACSKTSGMGYICPYCNAGFQEANYLKEHLRSHTGDKFEVCPHCDEVIRDRQTLKEHVKEHLEQSHDSPIISVESRSTEWGHTNQGSNGCSSALRNGNYVISPPDSVTQAIEILDSDEEAELCKDTSPVDTSSQVTTSHSSPAQVAEDVHTCNQCGKDFSHSEDMYQHLLTHAVIPHQPVNQGDVQSTEGVEQPQPNIPNLVSTEALGTCQPNSTNVLLGKLQGNNGVNMPSPQTLGQAQPSITSVLLPCTVGQAQPESRNVLFQPISQPSGTIVVLPQSPGQPQGHNTNMLSVQTLGQLQSNSGNIQGPQNSGQPQPNIMNALFAQAFSQPQSNSTNVLSQQTSGQLQPNNGNVLTVVPLEHPQVTNEKKLSKQNIDQPLPNTSNVLPIRNQPELPKSHGYVLKCPMCYFIFVSQSDVRKHIFQSHVVDTSHQCLLCNQAFKHISDMTIHMYAKHKKHIQVVCPFCSCEFRDESTLWEHISTHSVKLFDSGTHLENATDGNENTSSSQNVEQGNVKIEPGNEFVQLCKLPKQQESENLHFCGECGKGFKHGGFLFGHMKSHKERACLLCGLKFYKRGQLRRHMNSHTKSKQKETQPKTGLECGTKVAPGCEMHIYRKSDFKFKTPALRRILPKEHKTECLVQEHNKTTANNLSEGQRMHVPANLAAHPVNVESVTLVPGRGTTMTKARRKKSPYVMCIVCVHGFARSTDLRDHLYMHQLMNKC